MEPETYLAARTLGGSHADYKILRRALHTWGIDVQRQIAVGEIGELLSLFGKDAQGRATDEDWVDELADAFVVLKQLALIHGADDVARRVRDKMHRLEEILDGHTEHPHSPA